MTEQYIHSTNNTPTKSVIHTDKWKDKQKRHICTDVRSHTLTQRHEQTNHIGQQDNLCIKGDFKEIKDPVTIKDQNEKRSKSTLRQNSPRY